MTVIALSPIRLLEPRQVTAPTCSQTRTHACIHDDAIALRLGLIWIKQCSLAAIRMFLSRTAT
jgi:hypothetical protein